MLNRITAYTLFVLGLLTMLFFRHYTGDIIPYPWVFLLAGILMLIIGYALLRNSPEPKEAAARKVLRQTIADLKENGQQLAVDLTTCEIRSRDYIETKELYNEAGGIAQLVTPWPILGVMYLVDRSDRGGTEEVHQSVFICLVDNPRTGQTERYISPIIPKDKISLSFYLETQKTTTLYIDKADRARYYFDLDFLFAT